MSRNPTIIKELLLLRAALNTESSDPQDGYLYGKTYAAMAAEFGERIGKSVSARQIRHYVSVLKSLPAKALTYEPPRGFPKRTRRISNPRPPNLFGALGNELLTLTGLSASALYSALYDPQDQAKKVVALHEQGDIPRQAEALHAGQAPDPYPYAPFSCHQTRRIFETMQTAYSCSTFRARPDRRYLLVLGGYEEVTGYVDFRFFEAFVDIADKRRGRPIKREVPAEIVVTSSASEIALEISAERLATFISDMIAPLHVPVTRVQLRRSVAFSGDLDKLQMLLTGEEPMKASMTISMDDQPSHPHLPSHLPATIQPQEFSETLRAWVRQYNEKKAKSKVLKIRDDFNKELGRAQNIRNRFAKKYTREEQRLLDLKNFGLKTTSAQKLITNPCQYVYTRATIKKSTEPMPDAPPQAA